MEENEGSYKDIDQPCGRDSLSALTATQALVLGRTDERFCSLFSLGEWPDGSTPPHNQALERLLCRVAALLGTVAVDFGLPQLLQHLLMLLPLNLLLLPQLPLEDLVRLLRPLPFQLVLLIHRHPLPHGHVLNYACVRGL